MSLCRLQGNPTCQPGGSSLTQAIQAVCNTTAASPGTTWTSPLNSNKCPLCGDAQLTVNPRTCNCSYPLFVTLEIRQPTFSNIANDSLWDQFANQTYDSLSTLAQNAGLTFVSNQLYVFQAFLNASTQKVNVRVLFFPLDGEIMPQALQTLITSSFTGQDINYTSPWKPDLVLQIVPSEGTSDAPRFYFLSICIHCF